MSACTATCSASAPAAPSGQTQATAQAPGQSAAAVASPSPSMSPPAAPEALIPQIVADVVRMQMATAHIPGMVASEVRKNWREMEKASARAERPGFAWSDFMPKSEFSDPSDILMSLGWKERRSAVTYEMLKRAASSLAVVNAIIARRSSQVAMFTQPARQADGVGFEIGLKEYGRRMNAGEARDARDVEEIILYGGSGPADPWAVQPRQPFEQYVRAIMRDTFTFDAIATEPVHNPVTGAVREYRAVDASSIRCAIDTRQRDRARGGAPPGYPVVAMGPYAGRPEFDDEPFDPISGDGLPTRYVQVLDQKITALYSEREMLFGVRNPRTDIYVGFYGYSELEQGIAIVTALLENEKYQRNIFKNGSLIRGLLNLKGTEWTPEQLEALRRRWAAELSGASNSNRIPVIQFDGDAQWVNLQPSNKEMEYGRWQEFLIAVFCSLYLIDPEELYLQTRGGSSNTPLFEASSEWKMRASRDGGLKPHLKFLSGYIQRLVDLIDPRFAFRFVGLDEPSDREKHQKLLEELSTFKTPNEARQQKGLDRFDDPAADMLVNPSYLAARKLLNEEAALRAGIQQQGQGQNVGKSFNDYLADAMEERRRWYPGRTSEVK